MADCLVWLTITSGVYWDNGCIRIRDANHLATRLVEEWQIFDQIRRSLTGPSSSDIPRLQTCVQEQEEHFEHQL